MVCVCVIHCRSVYVDDARQAGVDGAEPAVRESSDNWPAVTACVLPTAAAQVSAA